MIPQPVVPDWCVVGQWVCRWDNSYAKIDRVLLHPNGSNVAVRYWRSTPVVEDVIELTHFLKRWIPCFGPPSKPRTAWSRLDDELF